MTLRTRLPDEFARSPTAPSLLVVSDSHAGSTLAGDFHAATDVTLVTDRDAVATATPDGVHTVVGDVTTIETLAAAHTTEATVAVIALQRDRQALLVRQLLRTRFGVGDVVVLLNNPERRAVLADTATTVICGSTCLAAALGDAVEQELPESTESHS